MGLKVGILGCGNMGTAIVQGLKVSECVGNIRVYDRNPGKVTFVRDLPGAVPIEDATTNQNWLDGLDALLLLVKPKDIENVLNQMKEDLHPDTLIVSCAAGLPIKRLRLCLPPNQRIGRAMPNTAARFGKSLTTLICDSDKDRNYSILETIFHGIGDVLILDDEDQMHAATALAGSGPAFFLFLTEAMAQSGHDLGLDPKTARKLAQGALKGAAVLAEDTSVTLAALRQQITSPNGTTEAGLMDMRAKKLDYGINQSVKAAHDRSRVMAREKKS